MNTLSSCINPMTRGTLPWEAHRRNWHAIREVLDHGRGYVIVKGFPVADRPEREISADFEALVSRLGTVTAHGASRQKIWRITPRPDLDHVPTFSEAAGEAPFHTDNSWVREPEHYFALLVIRPADVGGESLLCPVPNLLRDFARTRQGPAVIRTLHARPFPFALPRGVHRATHCRGRGSTGRPRGTRGGGRRAAARYPPGGTGGLTPRVPLRRPEGRLPGPARPGDCGERPRRGSLQRVPDRGAAELPRDSAG